MTTNENMEKAEFKLDEKMEQLAKLKRAQPAAFDKLAPTAKMAFGLYVSDRDAAIAAARKIIGANENGKSN
jgi:hypothetical protein